MANTLSCDPGGLVGLVLRLALAGVLFTAGGLKLIRRPRLEALPQALHFPTNRVVSGSLGMVPVIEILLAAWLLTGLRIALALGIVLLIFFAFTAILLSLVRRGYGGSCACFGSVDEHPVGLVQIGRNALLIAATTLAFVQALRNPCTGLAIREIPLPAVASATALLLAGAVAYVLAAEVEAFFRSAASQPAAIREGRRRSA